MATLLLIEDDSSVASFLKKGFSEEGFFIDVEKDGLKGFSKACSKKYDALIIDIDIQQSTGIEICRKMRLAIGYSIPILLLTAVASTETIIKGIEAGASDYLAIPFKFNDILARMTILLKKNHLGKTIQYADLKLNTVTKMVNRGNVTIDLTLKEYKLLEYFIANPCRVISRTMLLEDVWDKNADVSTNIVDVYVNYLRNKVDKGFPTKLIHTVVGMGYMLKVE
jgi:DNA-binding response OmpR family regulator